MRKTLATASGNKNIGNYFIESILVFIKQIWHMSIKGYLVTAVVVCIICVALFDIFDVCGGIHPVWIWAWIFVSGVIAVFPVVYGYGNCNLSDRVAYLLELYISIAAMWATIYTSAWLKNVEEVFRKKVLLLIVGCIFVGNLVIVDFRNSTLWTMRREIKWGTLQKYYSTVSSMWEQLENSEESDVILRGLVPNTNIIKRAELSGDSEHWINQAYAAFFDKNSVSRIPDD